MATQKPISTISYNSEGFLKEKLDTWIEAHIIQAYQFICHKGEDGDKDHIHLRIEPNKKLDPMTLTEDLREYVPGSDKPLGCRPWRPSKEEDWILYGVHDEDYLKQKYGGGEKGEKLPYSWKDIRVNEYYDIETAFIRARSYLEHTSSSIANRLIEGENALKMVMEGENTFAVNSVLRLLQSTDYQRLQGDYAALRNRYEALVNAVYDYGLTPVLNDDGIIVLEPDIDSPFKEV